MVTKTVGELWSDGPCRSCSCEAPDPIMMELLVSLGLEARGPEPSCTLQGCEGGLVMEASKFVVKEERVEGSCCPRFTRVACRDGDGLERAVAEEWREGKCRRVRCVLGEEGQVDMEADTEACPTSCPPGSDLLEPEEGVCCGQCSPLPECAIVPGEGGAVGRVQAQVAPLLPSTPPSRCLDMVSALTHPL